MISFVHRGTHATGLLLVAPLFAVAAARPLFAVAGCATAAVWAPPARRRAINSAETRNVAASTAKNVLKGRNVSNAAASAQPPIASACASRSTTAGMVAP